MNFGYIIIILLAIGVVVLSVFGKDFGIVEALKRSQDERKKQKEQYNKDVDNLVDECRASRKSASNKLRKIKSRKVGKTKSNLP